MGVGTIRIASVNLRLSDRSGNVFGYFSRDMPREFQAPDRRRALLLPVPIDIRNESEPRANGRPGGIHIFAAALPALFADREKAEAVARLVASIYAAQVITWECRASVRIDRNVSPRRRRFGGCYVTRWAGSGSAERGGLGRGKFLCDFLRRRRVQWNIDARRRRLALRQVRLCTDSVRCTGGSTRSGKRDQRQ
jgi:hypothetical protein